MLKYIFIICLSAFCSDLSAQQHTVVEGDVKNASDKKVMLTLYKYINITENNELPAELTKGKFKFDFNLKDPAYFSLYANNHELNFLIIEPGDSIHIEMDAKNPNTIIFTGREADLLSYQYESSLKFDEAFRPPLKPTVDNFKPYFSYIDSCKLAKLTFLNTFKGKLSETAYQILSADIFYDGELHKTRYFISVSMSGQAKAGNELYFSYFDQRKKFRVDDTMANAKNFISYLHQQNELDYMHLRNIDGGRFNFNSKYNLLKALTYSSIQERVLAYMLLLQVHIGPEAALTSVDDYLKGPYKPEFKEIIRNKYEFQQKFGPGKPALSFALPDVNNSIKILEDFKGKIVLVDFWFNGCVGCASLFQSMSYVKEHFKGNKNIVFVNISVDANKEQWLKGIQLYNIGDEVNLYTMGQGDKHPVIKSYGLNGYPAQFLIDKQGRYISAAPPRADADNGKALIQLIEASLAKN
jgi:thiol-disulfide isomerase/thioredoxin